MREPISCTLRRELNPLLIVLFVLAGACKPSLTPLCAGTGFGIRLRILSEAGENLAAVSTVTVVQLDPPGDSLTGPATGDVGGLSPIQLADDRPGTYRIRVQAPNYQPFVTTAIIGTKPDGCGGISADVTAVLKRA